MKIFAKEHTKNKGFTLIELLVVIAIIGILASVVLASLNDARQSAQNTFRKESLRQLQVALEAYYNDNGSYPITPVGWHGLGSCYTGVTNRTTSGPNGYIPDLAPKYIAELPVDPAQSYSAAFDNCSGFLYYSPDGRSFKILSHTPGPTDFPPAGQNFHDTRRPTWAYMLCSGEPACTGY